MYPKIEERDVGVRGIDGIAGRRDCEQEHQLQ